MSCPKIVSRSKQIGACSVWLFTQTVCYFQITKKKRFYLAGRPVRALKIKKLSISSLLNWSQTCHSKSQILEVFGQTMALLCFGLERLFFTWLTAQGKVDLGQLLRRLKILFSLAALYAIWRPFLKLDWDFPAKFLGVSRHFHITFLIQNFPRTA